MANIKFSEFTDVISTYSNIFIVGYDSVLNDNIRILSTDVPAIIGAITGSGTPGALPKFITDTSLGDSLISDDGTEVTIAGNINATAFIKVGGTSSQFLKADGSVDSNAYITLADLSASAPLSYDNSTGAFSIAQADSTTDGYLSALDWNTFNQKQAALGGTGIVKSTSGTISYITDNSANWNTAYDNMIVSAAVTGTTTKTLTLNQQDGGTITASWTDENTDAVTSVFGRTGAVVAQSGDYTTTQVTEGTNLYFTNARARAAFSENVTGLDYNSTTGVLSTTAGYGIPTTASQSNWDTAYNDRISTANLPLDITANVISISQSSSTTNGYLSSTDWTTFNSKQAAGNYITSLTGEATGSGPGAASVTLSNSAVIAKVLSGLNITGGTITSSDSILTAFGKVQNQINGLVGGVIYQGTWDASTNTPTLTSSEGTQGYYYIVNVAGSTNLDGITDWNVGDWAIFDGTTWQQVDNTDSVISVNGFTGIVSLTTSNIAEGSNLYYTDSRARLAFSESVTGLDYNSTTGVLSTTSGYGIPTTASQNNWNTAYNERIEILTTAGSSGSAILSSNTLNIPTYTLAGLGGVPTSRTLTINGISYDLSANRTWSIDSMVYPSAGIAISTGSSWGTSITDNSTNWNTAYSERISSATAPLSISSNIISISQSGAATNGYLSATDWNTFNSKQPTLSGTGLVKSTAGTISYITDNSGNWDTAYNDSIVSAAVTGTSTKTLTLTQQDGGTVTASWSDADTGLTSVGVSMPSAFTVSNSPLTSNGTIAITGAGTTAQYVRGDGTLATFPTISNEAQRLITEVYNETGATLTKGTVVYINGGHGNLPTITKALANSDATSAQTYGVVQNDITDQNNGFVVVIGSVIDLNTNSYPNGTILYLSPTVAGEWTSTKPYAPQHIVYVGIVTRSHPTQGVVEVRVQNGYEMDELHNVSAQNPNNGDILQFVTSTQLWTKTAGTTTNIAEGTNLYYTDARSRAAFSTTVVGLQYSSTTGVLGIQSGYSIPTNASQTNWNTAYTERISSATAPLSIVGNNISMSAAGISTNGYLTSADWNTFNDKQAAGSYITALTGEATASGPGSVAITLTNNAVTAKVLTGLNITGGTVNATDSIVTAFGKVQNQINSLVGGTIYKGVWNASTNSPSLSSGVGTQGWYYIVNVAGSTNLDGITDWNIGDWAIFDGTAWQQVDNTDSVTSVNGFTGAVSLTTSNISEGTNLYYTAARFNSAFAAKTTTDLTEGTNLYFTNARAQAAISLTTLGTSGAATYSGGVLNIPQYQAALTNPVTGVGTTNYVAKWTSGSAVGNSSIYDNGTFVGIGSTTALGGKLNITFDSTSADAIILKDTRASLGSGQWRIGPGSGVIGFGIYSDLLGYSPLAITNSGAATFSSSVTANGNVSSYGQLRLETSAYGSIVVGSRSSQTDFQIYNTGNIFRIYDGTRDAFTIASSGIATFNNGTVNQNTTISGSKVGMSRTSDGAEVVYFSKNTDLGAQGTANIQGYDGIQFRTQGAETVKLTIAASGVTTITNLAGSGSRMVVADASGVLSTQAIPAGTVTSVFGRTGAVVAVSGDYNTSQVTESGNLYFTNARAQAAISLTTTGSSGAATYSGGVLNIPDYSSALGAYLPLSGGTLTGALGGTSANFSSTVTAGTQFYVAATPNVNSGDLISIRDTSANGSNTTFGGVFFNSSPGNDFSVGKLSENSVGYFQIRNGNNGSELLRIAATGTATFSGVINSYATIDNLARRFNSPEGASLITSSSSITGAIKIKLPVATNNSATMMMFTVKIYQYSTGNAHEIQIGGYNYNLGGWYNPSVTNLTDNGANLTVYFGNDGTSDCLWIGETSSTWSYPQVFVTDFQAGYNGQTNAWGTGWGISFQTSYDTIESSRLASQVITSRSIGAQSVNYAVSAGTAGALTSMLISQFTNDSGYITSGALSGYLPLTGGTLSGNLVIQGNASSAITLYKFYSGSPSNVGMTFTDTAGTVTIAFNSNGGRVSSTAWTTTGRNYSNEWIEFPNYSGLYSPNNSAELYPNNGSYGSWKVRGSRSGWGGLEFEYGSNGNITLMIGGDSNSVGFHNNSYGWQLLWQNGTLYVFKNAYGAGTQATVLDSSNYNSYAPTLTGTGASGTWGISITGNAYYSTYAGSADAIDGYAFSNTGSGTPVNADTLNSNGISYYTAGVPNFTGNATDGALYSQAYSSAWQHQIAADYRSGQIALRGKNSGTWQSWRVVLDDANYSSYALPLSGGTITGDLTVNNKVYIGTSGCYIQSVLIGSVYEIQVVDSAGNMTIIS